MKSVVSSVGIMALAMVPSVVLGYDYLDIVPLEARQADGEKFECHAACGYGILGIEQDDYCDNSTWVDLIEECLDCAQEFDIWQHYGEGVSEAAESCNIEVPAAGEDEESSSASAHVSAFATPAPSESLPVPPAASSDVPGGEEDGNDEDEDDAETIGDNAGERISSSGSMMLFGMIVAAGAF